MVTPSLAAIALKAVLAHKLRSGLTLLGIVIGVTSVMTIISALEGMTQSIERDLSRLGPSTFIVQRIAIITSDEMFYEKIKRKPVTLSAVEAITERADLVEKVSPRAMNRASVKYKDQSLRRVFVAGTTANYIDIIDFDVAQGRFHSPEDDKYRRPVCFVGDAIREEFFAGVDPLGKTLKVGSAKYTVIGVANKMGSSFGQNRDAFVIIPLSIYSQQFGAPRRGLTLMIKAYSIDVLDDAMDQTRMILRAHRQVPFNKGDDFDMVTADSILEMLNTFTRILRFGLVGISSISVVVGGIVVMNIMMVSVTERTREIGIRRSIGARKQHLLLQFLFESLILTLSGGIIGIVAGFLIAQALVGMMEMEMEPSMLAIVAGLGISTGIGLIFGIYPAMRAAKLDPIKALSYE